MKKRKNSCAKGKRIEREAAKYLQSLGFEGCVRAARNGVDNASDLVTPSLPNVHLEIKGDESIDLGTKALRDAILQALLASDDNQSIAVLWKKNRTSWRLTFCAGTPRVMCTVTEVHDITAALKFLNERRALEAA